LQLSNGRRRFVAALSALGLASVTGLRPAQAQTAPCQSIKTTGNESNGEHNYIITADLAQFAYQVPIETLVDEIVLFDPASGGGRKLAGAAVKGELERRENGTIGIKAITFWFPVTALERDGNFYSIVQMAHDQNVPIGLQLTSGTTSLGGTAMEKGVFDPNSNEQGFNGNAALAVYQALMSREPFTAELMSGGVAYSVIRVNSGGFATFVEDTLVPEMERMKLQDETAPCDPSLNDILFDADDDDVSCFLTTACCNVVGLADDCWELATLRRFRDGWMSTFPAGRADVARYYAEAPAVAERLSSTLDGRRRLLGLYWRVIVPCALMARLGLNAGAYRLYRRMMTDMLAA
jgi:hypothetical protein